MPDNKAQVTTATNDTVTQEDAQAAADAAAQAHYQSLQLKGYEVQGEPEGVISQG
jgi:hypothetical protein